MRSRSAEGTAWSDAGLKQDRSARVVIAGHGFVQNLQRGHDELAVEEPVHQRVAVAFDELALAI
jgi:transposase, IS6 family